MHNTHKYGKEKRQPKLKGVSKAELTKNLKTFQEELRALRFKGEGSKSKNVKEESVLKKKIARVLTEINK